jgi:hypothetical protein
MQVTPSKFKIYYRLSDKGHRYGKPDFINVENCLRNFCEHFDSNTITIIADNCEDDTIAMVKKIVKSDNNIIRTSLGNSGACLFTIQKAIEENDDDTMVYLVEDDYLHVNGSYSVLREGFRVGDYITLYDHPDKYLDGGKPNPLVFGGGEETKVLLTNKTHWKYTNSTTMTFATRVKILREDYEIFIKYLKRKIPEDFQLFRELICHRKRKLLVSLPGRSTHGQLPWLCPLTEWHKQ